MEKEGSKGKGTVRFGFKTSKTLRKTYINNKDLDVCWKAKGKIDQNLARMMEEHE